MHPLPQPQVCLATKSDFGKEVGANDDKVLIAVALLQLLLPLYNGGGRLRGAQQEGGGGPVEGVSGGC